MQAAATVGIVSMAPVPRIEINGHGATADQLGFPALVNYGHFTAMQVRNRRVRGLDLHLARLDSATRELFGASLDGSGYVITSAMPSLVTPVTRRCASPSSGPIPTKRRPSW